LHDEGADALRVPRREPEADGAAEVLSVDGVAPQLLPFDEVLDDVGQVIERVLELGHRRRVAVAEARVVGRDEVKIRSKRRHKIAEHVRRRREAVQQQQRRGVA
jgi:hypothetical protein